MRMVLGWLLACLLQRRPTASYMAECLFRTPKPHPPPTTGLPQGMLVEANRRFSFCSHNLMDFDLDAAVIGYRLAALAGWLALHLPDRTSQ